MKGLALDSRQVAMTDNNRHGDDGDGPSRPSLDSILDSDLEDESAPLNPPAYAETSEQHPDDQTPPPLQAQALTRAQRQTAVAVFLGTCLYTLAYATFLIILGYTRCANPSCPGPSTETPVMFGGFLALPCGLAALVSLHFVLTPRRRAEAMFALAAFLGALLYVVLVMAVFWRTPFPARVGQAIFVGWGCVWAEVAFGGVYRVVALVTARMAG